MIRLLWKSSYRGEEGGKATYTHTTQAHPRHPEGNCWGRRARARGPGAGTGRGASPGPACSFFPPPPGRASPPRRRCRRRQAARGPSEPSAARSWERERERARSRQPAWAASGAVSQPRSWNLKRQTRPGVWGPCPREGHARRPPDQSERSGPTGPCEKSFLHEDQP